MCGVESSQNGKRRKHIFLIVPCVKYKQKINYAEMDAFTAFVK